jgi:DNA-directed RNA polymerase specialized sigma24 family protein
LAQQERTFEDLRQDIYVRVYEAARKHIPERAKPFVFTTARNMLINRMRRRKHVVPIETVADLDALSIAMDAPGPDRNAMARDELRRLAGSPSTGCRRVAAKPSCWGASKACPAARLRCAWASRKPPSPSI